MARSIPVIDFDDYLSEDQSRRENFISKVGDSLKDIGFFALKNHGIPIDLIEKSYQRGDEFFSLDDSVKSKYLQPNISHHLLF